MARNTPLSKMKFLFLRSAMVKGLLVSHIIASNKNTAKSERKKMIAIGEIWIRRTRGPEVPIKRTESIKGRYCETVCL